MMLRSPWVTAFVVECLLAIGGAAQAQPGKPQAVRLDGPLVQISCVPELRFVSVLTKVGAIGDVIGQTSAGGLWCNLGNPVANRNSRSACGIPIR